MRRMIYTSFFLALITAAYMFFPHHLLADITEKGNGAAAAVKASDPNFKSSQADIIELFTSQGCYSCPPAEALMRKLSQSPDIITFEYHVDYWDKLVYGAAGKWKDPFSSPEATLRQSDYNLQIRNKHRSYTPQAIINGTYEMVGSRPRDIKEKLGIKPDYKFEITPTLANQRSLNVAIAGDIPNNAIMTYVQFIKRHVTDVKSGENKGKKLASYNIVTKWHKMSQFDAKKQTQTQLSLKNEIPTGQGCFIYLSNPETMEIYGGSFCKKI